MPQANPEYSHPVDPRNAWWYATQEKELAQAALWSQNQRAAEERRNLCYYDAEECAEICTQLANEAFDLRDDLDGCEMALNYLDDCFADHPWRPE